MYTYIYIYIYIHFQPTQEADRFNRFFVVFWPPPSSEGELSSRRAEIWPNQFRTTVRKLHGKQDNTNPPVNQIFNNFNGKLAKISFFL